MDIKKIRQLIIGVVCMNFLFCYYDPLFCPPRPKKIPVKRNLTEITDLVHPTLVVSVEEIEDEKVGMKDWDIDTDSDEDLGVQNLTISLDKFVPQVTLEEALIEAASAGEWQQLLFLCGLKIDVNCQDSNNGETSLMKVVKNPRCEPWLPVVEKLLTSGALVHIPDCKGNTLLKQDVLNSIEKTIYEFNDRREREQKLSEFETIKRRLSVANDIYLNQANK